MKEKYFSGLPVYTLDEVSQEHFSGTEFLLTDGSDNIIGAFVPNSRYLEFRELEQSAMQINFLQSEEEKFDIEYENAVDVELLLESDHIAHPKSANVELCSVKVENENINQAHPSRNEYLDLEK